MAVRPSPARQPSIRARKASARIDRCENLYYGNAMVTANDLDSAFVLAFETSCALGAVALGRGASALASSTFSGPRKHATEFLPAVDSLCRAHEVAPDNIALVCVSGGPGSFTGLRIGITAARLLALALGTPVVTVPTLKVIAQNALAVPDPPTHVAVLLDAKRRRVYAAAFERHTNGYEPLCAPAEVDPQVFLGQQTRSCAVMGEGVAYHREAVEATGLRVLPETTSRPLAETVLRLGVERARAGEYENPRTVVPVYIRPPEAEEKWAQRQQTQGR